MDDHEKRGLYLFHVMRCRHKDQDLEYFGMNTEEHKMGPQSPLRQKPIDLYDLMDVELRMIRQKNLDMEHQFKDSAQSAKQINAAADGEEIDDEIVPNQRSKAFSHIESVMKDNLVSLANKERDNSSNSRRVIDMNIIDRIKNMRSKSRDK